VTDSAVLDDSYFVRAAAGGWARTLGYIFMAYLFLTNPMLAIMAYFMYQGVVQRARA